jgi:hypothetical protein
MIRPRSSCILATFHVSLGPFLHNRSRALIQTLQIRQLHIDHCAGFGDEVGERRGALVAFAAGADKCFHSLARVCPDCVWLARILSASRRRSDQNFCVRGISSPDVSPSTSRASRRASAGRACISCKSLRLTFIRAFPQGLKAHFLLTAISARANSCPDTNPITPWIACRPAQWLWR